MGEGMIQGSTLKEYHSCQHIKEGIFSDQGHVGRLIMNELIEEQEVVW
jgi:hypothetical protein